MPRAERPIASDRFGPDARPVPRPELPWLAEPLRTLLDGGREHHALLVHGLPGVGQFELALKLAKGWLCEADPADGRPPLRPCGRCAACHLVDAHHHPDLKVLLPELLREALGWTTADDDSDRAKDRKPSKEIKVDAVRDAIGFAQTSSARGRAKVVVLHPAERINLVGANALLKTLEEPPGQTRFVLASGAADRLPPTIRSRCRRVWLAPPPAEIARAWLAEQGVADPDGVLLAATGGRPLAVLEWASEGITPATWQRLPAAVAAGDIGPVISWPLPRAIEALQKVCHDALLASVGQPPRYFPESPRAGRPLALQAWSRALAQAARHADHPWNAGLLVESLVLQGREALRTFESPPTRSIHSIG